MDEVIVILYLRLFIYFDLGFINLPTLPSPKPALKFISITRLLPPPPIKSIGTGGPGKLDVRIVEYLFEENNFMAAENVPPKNGIKPKLNKGAGERLRRDMFLSTSISRSTGSSMPVGNWRNAKMLKIKIRSNYFAVNSFFTKK